MSSSDTDNYSFRLVTKDDLSLVRAWRRTPPVRKWFGEGQDDYDDDLQDSRIRMQIVSLNNEPFAHVQDYDVHGWPDHPFSFLPKDARGIDTYIGKPDLLGRGHGTAYLCQLRDQLFADGVPALGIDPHPDNVAARNAYGKVGFQGDKEMDTEWGRVVLMSLTNPIV